MNYPSEYIEYLIQFHATRDFFECHELLEEYWKKQLDDPLADLWVAMIQIAVGQYHERRGKQRGALLMYEAALNKLAKHNSTQLGLEHKQLVKLLNQRVQSCNMAEAYQDINLPFEDLKLLAQCQKLAQSRGLIWGLASSEVDDNIIYRHTRRDRSEVIAARLAALQQKRQQSGQAAIINTSAEIPTKPEN